MLKLNPNYSMREANEYPLKRWLTFILHERKARVHRVLER